MPGFLDILQAAWRSATPDERARFLESIGATLQVTHVKKEPLPPGAARPAENAPAPPETKRGSG